MSWQARRLRGAFPVELPLSRSVVVARSGRCGVSTLVNAIGTYDHGNMSLVRELLAEGGGFVDVGANIGSYTLIAAEQPTARVLALEPHPTTFEALSANVRRNACENVQPICAAVGNREGNVCITDWPGDAGTHITQDNTGVRVPLRRLDVLLEERSFCPDIVKIDVEGFELDVLRGMGSRLRDVRVLFVEINGLGDARGGGASAVLELIEEAGFLPAHFYDSRRRTLVRTPIIEDEDPIFVHSSFIASLRDRFGIEISRES
jgi:FkbM family methyltransferase